MRQREGEGQGARCANESFDARRRGEKKKKKNERRSERSQPSVSKGRSFLRLARSHSRTSPAQGLERSKEPRLTRREREMRRIWLANEAREDDDEGKKKAAPKKTSKRREERKATKAPRSTLGKRANKAKASRSPRHLSLSISLPFFSSFPPPLPSFKKNNNNRKCAPRCTTAERCSASCTCTPGRRPSRPASSGEEDFLERKREKRVEVEGRERRTKERKEKLIFSFPFLRPRIPNKKYHTAS